jgi:hypothetical protein
MALTRTPRGPYSAAHALVSSSMAARLAPYMASPGCPKLATMVEVLTMAPQPRSAIAGARAATRKNGTLTLTVNVSSNSASVAESDGPPSATPALLTRMSTWPSPAATAHRASSRTDATSVSAVRW